MGLGAWGMGDDCFSNAAMHAVNEIPPCVVAVTSNTLRCRFRGFLFDLSPT